MHPDQFAFIAGLLHQRSGLKLAADRMYLLESRLLPVARNRGFADAVALVDHLQKQPSEEIFIEVTEAMTTNESLFFRDGKPFDILRQKVLPALHASLPAGKKIRIWSAACSMGQEPYSIAICLREEAAKIPGRQSEIIATDIAKKVLDKATRGIYSQFEVQRGLPIQQLVKYFAPLPDTSWKVKQELAGMVNFRMQNLLENFLVLGEFDIIFCRNVLIYFDDATKKSVLDRISRALRPGGYLVLGSTETMFSQAENFTQLEDARGIYLRKE